MISSTKSSHASNAFTNKLNRQKNINVLMKKLRSLLREWYGFRWQETQRKLADALAAVKNQEKQVQARQDDLEALERKTGEIRLVSMNCASNWVSGIALRAVSFHSRSGWYSGTLPSARASSSDRNPGRGTCA